LRGKFGTFIEGSTFGITMIMVAHFENLRIDEEGDQQE